MEKTDSLKKRLDARKDLQGKLFVRSWLLTEKPFTDKLNDFPFYGHWKEEKVGRFYLMVQEKASVHHVTVDGITFFLFGHCYNPFTMEWEEEKQLQKIASEYGKEGFQRAIDEITGIFSLGWYNDKEITFITDPSGMQSTYYGIIDGNCMLTSHPQIIGDLYNLEIQDIVKELVNYKWYGRVMGCYLPGDLSTYKEVTRVVPNISYTYKDGKVEVNRFYPKRPVHDAEGKEYQEVIEQAADILKNGAELVLKKWKKPAVSLTGGIDSNTTYSAFNGHYKDIDVFSYLSAPKEVPDVEAAEKIAKHFNCNFTLYHIPSTNDEVKDFELLRDMIAHVNGYIVNRKENETRKRIYLEENLPYDVEVKSWVSETIRAYWYKHYGRTSMPKLSPKLYRNLYKIFTTNRSLAHKVDKVFKEYIEKYDYYNIPEGYLPADMHFNEVTWGSWGGLNISEMKYYTDITILYNNRIFLDLLFRAPLAKRISDEHHIDMKRYLNKELADMNIRVVNMAETANRARLLNIIFTLNSVLPF
jgi:hypothetical protein